MSHKKRFRKDRERIWGIAFCFMIMGACIYFNFISPVHATVYKNGYFKQLSVDCQHTNCRASDLQDEANDFVKGHNDQQDLINQLKNQTPVQNTYTSVTNSYSSSGMDFTDFKSWTGYGGFDSEGKFVSLLDYLKGLFAPASDTERVDRLEAEIYLMRTYGIGNYTDLAVENLAALKKSERTGKMVTTSQGYDCMYGSVIPCLKAVKDSEISGEDDTPVIADAENHAPDGLVGSPSETLSCDFYRQGDYVIRDCSGSDGLDITIERQSVPKYKPWPIFTDFCFWCFQ